jgi:hypothetical protein
MGVNKKRTFVIGMAKFRLLATPPFETENLTLVV